MPKLFRKSTFVFIGIGIVSIYLLSIIMSIFTSNKHILFSPVSWYIVVDKKPVSWVTVTRWHKWGFYSNEGKESVITDKDGYFSFPKTISIRSLLISIIPHEAVITQRMFVEYDGKEIQIYETVKHNYDMNWEYRWKSLEFVFDPTQKEVQYIHPPLDDITTISIRGTIKWDTVLRDYEYASFPSNHDISIISNEKVRFTPDTLDEQLATKLLIEYLQNNQTIQDLWEYRAQYFGFMNTDNEKVILANFFCRNISESDWKKDVIITLDGGNCYFQIKVNLDTEATYDLQINKES